MNNMYRKIKYKMKKVNREPETIKIKPKKVPKWKNTMTKIKNLMNIFKR